jgi:hypothetical protein
MSGRIGASTHIDGTCRGLDSEQRARLSFSYVLSVRPRRQSKTAKRPAATAQPLLLGAAVRLGRSGATGVVIGNSADIDRVRVRWDDTGEVTNCFRANLVPAAR